MLKLSGLWSNTSKRGTKYLSGTLGNLKVFVFKNPNKTTENQPDYELLIDERARRSDNGFNSGLPETAVEVPTNVAETKETTQEEDWPFEPDPEEFA